MKYEVDLVEYEESAKYLTSNFLLFNALYTDMVLFVFLCDYTLNKINSNGKHVQF